MQTCLWTQGIWIYNHLISISKYTHQISTSLILIFSFSDWNNGWSILNKKQIIVCFVFTLRIYRCYLRAKCRKLFSALKTKVHSIFVSCFILVELTAVAFCSLVFLLYFLYLTNPVRMTFTLFGWSQGCKTMMQHPVGPFSFLCAGQLSKTSPGWAGGEGISRSNSDLPQFRARTEASLNLIGSV